MLCIAGKSSEVWREEPRPNGVDCLRIQALREIRKNQEPVLAKESSGLHNRRLLLSDLRGLHTPRGSRGRTERIAYMNIKNVKRDIILYICMAAASLAVYFWIIPSQIYMNSTAKQEAFNPDTFPKFVTIVFFLACVGGAINAARLYRQAVKTESAKEKAERRKLSRKELLTKLMPYIIFALTLVYGLLFKFIGFIPATALMIPVFLLVIGCRRLSYYAIVYMFTAGLYLLFRFVVHVPIR